MATLLVLVTVSLALVPILPAQAQPWAQFVLAAGVAVLITLRRRGRPLLSRRQRPRHAPVDVVDLVAPDRSLVGCVEGPRVVTTAVEVSAGALVATEVGHDSPADFDGVSLPLVAAARQLDQGGILLEGIDVVIHGRSAADGPDGEVYSSLVGPLPLISRRRVHLLVRFDLARLTLDAEIDADYSLQRVVTVATERLRRSLVHHGVPCRVLDATELADLYLASEAEPRSGAGLVVRPGADPRGVVDALSAVRSSAITEVLRLRRVEGRPDAVDTVTTVGLAGVDEASLPSWATASCHPLPNARVLPIPGEALPEALAGNRVRRRLAELDELAPPAHGAGQILGATRSGAASAVQLAGPHLRSVLLAARPAVCRQVTFRAVAAGYRIAVVTDVPDRWRPLLVIGDESRYRIVDPDSSDAGTPVDAVIWDVDGRLTEGRIDALAGPDVTPPTVIRVDADWDAGRNSIHSAAAPPDLVLDGRIDGWISVEPASGAPHQVSVVAGPGEESFVGPLTGPEAGSSAASGAAPDTESDTGPATGPTTDELIPSGAAPSASQDRP